MSNSTSPGQLTSAAFKFDSFVRSGVDPRTGTYSCTVALDAVPADAAGGPKVSLTLSYDCFNDTDLGLGTGWSLRTCRFDQRRGKLTLTNGETYQLFTSGDQVTFLDKKLDNLRVTSTAGLKFFLAPARSITTGYWRASIGPMARKRATSIVFCLEGDSWRRSAISVEVSCISTTPGTVRRHRQLPCGRIFPPRGFSTCLRYRTESSGESGWLPLKILN